MVHVGAQLGVLGDHGLGADTEKPAANADVKRWINEGSLLWNYIGHGNPFKMADENAFNRALWVAIKGPAVPYPGTRRLSALEWKRGK